MKRESWKRRGSSVPSLSTDADFGSQPCSTHAARPNCAEISALVTERAFHHLEAPVLRVGGYNVPYPPSRIEEEFLPDLDRVLDAVDRSLAY